MCILPENNNDNGVLKHGAWVYQRCRPFHKCHIAASSTIFSCGGSYGTAVSTHALWWLGYILYYGLYKLSKNQRKHLEPGYTY